MKRTLFFITFLMPLASFAQSLILGIPNATVAEKNHLELTHETQLFKDKQGAVSWNSFNFACFGLNKNLELTTSFNNLGIEKGANKAIGLGAKWVQPLFKEIDNNEWRPKLIAGANSYYSISNEEFGFWVYGLSAFRLPELCTRFSFGLSYATAPLLGYDKQVSEVNPNDVILRPYEEANILIGLEQPINESFSIVADYFGGEHDLGALIVGMQYETEKNVFIIANKLANEESKGNAIILEIMQRF